MHELHVYDRLHAIRDPSGIVRLVGTGGTPDHLVRVLERSHKGELQRFLRNGRGRPEIIDPDLAHSILAQIAASMADLHALDLVHRDLKAENILVFDADANADPGDWRSVRVKLADFDRAGELPKGAFFDEPIGSLFHMAPELLAGERYDRRVDIYAFGILMFEVVHGGARPFPKVATGMPDAMTAQEFAAGVVEDCLRPDWHEQDGLLHDLASRCLSSDPEERPEFEEILHILRPPPGSQPAAKPLQRHPTALPPTLGMACDIGRQRRVMEDASCILNTDDVLILAVFDGLRDDRSSTFTAHRLVLTLAHLLEGQPDADHVETSIREAFDLTQSSLRRIEPPITCGSTATVVLVRPDHILIAWLGDSPAWVIRKDANGAVSSQPLIRAHHPTREDEARRVAAEGGTLQREERMMDSGELVPWGPLRVFVPDNPHGNGVALTRALGAPAFGPAISAEPEIIRLERTAEDQFLMLCSDGVTEVLTPAQLTSICVDSATPQQAADHVMEQVLKAGAPDNATVVIADLSKHLIGGNCASIRRARRNPDSEHPLSRKESTDLDRSR